MIHFLDIGANVGQTFDCYLQHHPELFGCKVWCFEPSPRHLAGLLATALRYGDKFRIVVCPFGLGACSESAIFHEKVDHVGDSFYEDFWSQDRHVIDRDVAYKVCSMTQRITEFLAQIPVVDEIIIKIDAEGSEFPILSAILERPNCLGNVKQIMVEWHTIPGHDPERYKALFAEQGRPLEVWPF